MEETFTALRELADYPIYTITHHVTGNRLEMEEDLYSGNNTTAKQHPFYKNLPGPKGVLIKEEQEVAAL